MSAQDADGTEGREDSGAQQRQLTVMFSDLVASTVLAERLDPEDFREVLGEYHEVCARAVERFGGYVAQYQGDGVIAYFGYPRAHEDDAPRAVLASLAILDGLADLNQRLGPRLGIALQVRIGLDSGMTIAGDLGTGPGREQHVAVGETLHIAARVQTLAPPDTVVVTDATLALVGDRFETSPLGAQILKGISHPVGIHSVARVAEESAFVAGAHTEAPLVDRTAELARLIDAWRAASQGGGVVVHSIGEAGIGKSRLVRALRHEVRSHGGAECILQCSPHYATTELYPVVHFIERRSGLDRSQPAEVRLKSLEGWVSEAGLNVSETVPLLSELISLPGAQRAPARDPGDVRSATLRALEELLVFGERHAPLLLVVEDLHWADPTTVELLERIANSLARRRVVCVFTFRREFTPPWTESNAIVEVELGPLGADDVRAMVAAAGYVELDQDDLSRVESATEGVPLFIEEMVKALVAARSATRPEGTRVPATLHGLLAERLDRLPELGEVIDVAAVLGREFERGLAEALSPLDRAGFTSAVARLAIEDVLQPVEGSRTRLEFKHALLQEAAYDRLLRARRRELHARVAQLLVAHRPSVWEAEPERIAHHWSCANQPAKALAYWELAGRRALERAAFLEAAEHFRRAVESLDAARPSPDGEAERGELLTYLGAAMQAGTSPAADVESIYVRARTACERTNKRERLLHAMRGLCMLHIARAEYPDAFSLAEELCALGEAHERHAWLGAGRYFLGFTRMLTGDLVGARDALEESGRLYDPQLSQEIAEAHSGAGVGAYAYLSSLLWNQGHAEQAFAVSDHSLELAEQTGGSAARALAWGMRCSLLLQRGDAIEFSRWLEKARKHSVERNVGYWSTVCSIWSAWVRGHTGDVAGAIDVMQRDFEDYVDSGSRVGIPHFKTLLADLHLLAGDAHGAVELLCAGQRHIDATGERFYEPDVQWFLGRALMSGASPDEAAASAAYERAIESARAQGARLSELRATTGLALHQRRIGAQGTAMALLEELSESFDAGCEIPEVMRARTLLAGEAAQR